MRSMPSSPEQRPEGLRRALEAIGNSEPGPRIGAFFDYDGTVISGFSAGAFYEHRIRNLEIGPIELARTLLARGRGINSAEDFAAFLEISLGAWRGRTEDELDELGRSLFKHAIASRLHLEGWEVVEASRARGRRLVL